MMMVLLTLLVCFCRWNVMVIELSRCMFLSKLWSFYRFLKKAMSQSWMVSVPLLSYFDVSVYSQLHIEKNSALQMRWALTLSTGVSAYWRMWRYTYIDSTFIWHVGRSILVYPQYCRVRSGRCLVYLAQRGSVLPHSWSIVATFSAVFCAVGV